MTKIMLQVTERRISQDVCACRNGVDVVSPTCAAAVATAALDWLQPATLEDIFHSSSVMRGSPEVRMLGPALLVCRATPTQHAPLHFTSTIIAHVLLDWGAQCIVNGPTDSSCDRRRVH